MWKEKCQLTRSCLQEERNAWELQDVEDRPELLPNSFPSLRLVPAYENFINERFERCLDLYLCPRTRKKRLFVKDPETLVPKLSKPQDLQPFPSQLLLRYEGHKGPVRGFPSCRSSLIQMHEDG